MAIPIATLQPIAAFDPHGDQNTFAQRWEKWIRSFELFSSATGCKDKQKRDLSLHTFHHPIRGAPYPRGTLSAETADQKSKISFFLQSPLEKITKMLNKN
mgnify:CR=1